MGHLPTTNSTPPQVRNAAVSSRPLFCKPARNDAFGIKWVPAFAGTTVESLRLTRSPYPITR
jgi:hypothetical protein